MTHVLACAVGLTPQIVTESIWALAVAGPPPWSPDRLAIITTGSGARLVHETLLHPQRGAIAKLGYAYGRPDIARLAGHADIQVIRRHRFVVEDVTDTESASATDEAAYEFIREITSPATSELCLVIAGGRKSLSVALGIAMSLCGRACDQLLHVLVDRRREAPVGLLLPDPGDKEAAGRPYRSTLFLFHAFARSPILAPRKATRRSATPRTRTRTKSLSSP